MVKGLVLVRSNAKGLWSVFRIFVAFWCVFGDEIFGSVNITRCIWLSGTVAVRPYWYWYLVPASTGTKAMPAIAVLSTGTSTNE